MQSVDRATAARYSQRGLTILEFLITTTLLVMLSTVLLWSRATEAIKKTRDTQRISDLAVLKTAIGIYQTATIPPFMSGPEDNKACKSRGSYPANGRIFYSFPNTVSGSPITDVTLDGGSQNVPAAGQVSRDALLLTDGSGWLPINFDGTPIGRPLSDLPVDPINTISDPKNVGSSDMVYRYVCGLENLTYEIDATLESDAYGPGGIDDKSIKDGGNNPNYYESGTNLRLLGSGIDF